MQTWRGGSEMQAVYARQRRFGLYSALSGLTSAPGVSNRQPGKWFPLSATSQDYASL